MASKPKSGIKRSQKIQLLLLFTIFSIVLLSVSVAKFPIDYTNGKADNSTVAENNAKTMIEAQTVPTIINGVAATTSIIIGFSAALIGIVFRELFSNDKIARDLLIAFLTLFIISIFSLFNSYYSLTVTGQFNLENALRSSMLALTFSIFLLLFVFLFVFILNGRNQLIDYEYCRNY
jgi:uncharacterized membrane protein